MTTSPVHKPAQKKNIQFGVLNPHHGRMARGGHGLPKVSPGPTLPYSSMPCRQAIPRAALPPFWGWLGCTAGGLRPSSTLLDTPPCRPMIPMHPKQTLTLKIIQVLVVKRNNAFICPSRIPLKRSLKDEGRFQKSIFNKIMSFTEDGLHPAPNQLQNNLVHAPHHHLPFPAPMRVMKVPLSAGAYFMRCQGGGGGSMAPNFSKVSLGTAKAHLLYTLRASNSCLA
jgi:hypothetical protein